MTIPKTLNRQPVAPAQAVDLQEIDPHREASVPNPLPESTGPGSPRIVVIALLTLVPGREDQWVEAWSELAQRALDDPRSGCYGLRLLHNIADHNRYVIVSEWESRSAFDGFIRSAGALWISRGLEYSFLPVQVMYLQGIAAHATGS